MCQHSINIQTCFLSFLVKGLGLALLWFGSPLNAMGCDPGYVHLPDKAQVIKVAPTGLDDTYNIQCALALAQQKGIPVVQLEAGTFYISSIDIEDFKGTFQGKTIEETTIQVLDRSIDCSDMEFFGRNAAAIIFRRGEPRIRFMTIKANSPCEADYPLYAILHFTGGWSSDTRCNNEVIFAVVDRVRIDGTGSNIDTIFAGVVVSPEGDQLGGCNTTLLGTFKLNRSSIFNVFAGLQTTMKSLAQVDINFNEFRGTQLTVNIIDSNQSTTISGNTFFGASSAVDAYRSILVNNWNDNPPPSTRVVINKNQFNVASSVSDGLPSTVIKLGSFKDVPISAISAVITNNTFNLSGELTTGISAKEISNVHVATNTFKNWGYRAIRVSGDTPVSGWTIIANGDLGSFSSTSTYDIWLDSNTSECIVGPGQGASVWNNGTNNTILTQ